MPMTSSAVKREATRLGFDLCGVAPAAGFPELRFLREWLDCGCAGDMAYMARSADRRDDVRRVLPSARAVIVAAALYNVNRPYSTEVGSRDCARIARYAWGDDYHDVLGRRLNALLDWMRREAPEPFEATWYVDTGPVQERVYAQYAGLGWIGKNTCLINPQLGSWIFLCELIVSLALEPDAPGLDQCGSCTLCLEACPTGALVQPRVLDATRCLAYLTIERRGGLPERLRGAIGNHVYGCDICQDVCPWNHRPAVSGDPAWQPRPAFDRPALATLWRATDEELRASLDGSPMKRAKLAGLRRNVAVAIGNSASPDAASVFDEPSDDAVTSSSKADPVVREHVEWARRQLRG
jgi:epoxyqueuosine reductase